MALPALLISLGLHLALLINAFRPGLSPLERQANLGQGLLGISYTVLIFVFLLPILDRYRLFIWVASVLNGLLAGVVYFLEPFTLPGTYLMIASAIILTTAVLVGRWPTYLFSALALGIQVGLPAVIGIAGPHPSHVITLLVISVGATESIANMQDAIGRHNKRLEAIRIAAHKLASSLEMDEVLLLIQNAVQNSLTTDTYYVGLVQDHEIRLALFYDEGEFFNQVKVPLEGSLAGWVVTNQQSLLARDLQRDSIRKKIPFKVVGKAKASRSWMGTPLRIGNEVVGMLAVASYRRNTFDRQDLEMLENIAQLGSMALDNARHHQKVELQSHLDSLTGALNHGYFLQQAQSLMQQASEARPFSLIMLDIDHFKAFNDSYGHLVGDQTLEAITACIRASIHATDLVGRWGGEEFAIALPNSNAAQSCEIARRIRSNLEQLEILNRGNRNIEPPTVSQGIAIYPGEAKDIYRLIDLADQRLYQAKAAGRNRIGSALEGCS